MAEKLSRKDIANTLLTSLKGVLAKHEASFKAALEKEAKGMKKLQKNELANDNGALPDLGKGALDAAPVADASAPMAASEDMCLSCMSKNLEPLGEHMGLGHYFCKDCGEVGATVREENAAAEGPMVKSTPPDISEKTAHKLKDEYGHDKEGKAKAYATMWSIHNKMKKGDMVENARLAAGIGSGTKVASTRVPTPTNTVKPKDAFNTGGANNVAKAENDFNKGKDEVPNTKVATEAAEKGAEAPKAGKKVDTKGSGGDIEKGKLAKDEHGFAAMDNKAKQMAANPAPVAAVPAAKPQSPYQRQVNINQPAPKRQYDSTDPTNPTVRQKVNTQIGQTQGAQKATSVATIRQRWNSGINDKIQRSKINTYHDMKRQANPVQKAEESMEKAAGIPSAPKAPGATPPAAPAVKAPVSSPVATPTKTPSKL